MKTKAALYLMRILTILSHWLLVRQPRPQGGRLIDRQHLARLALACGGMDEAMIVDQLIRWMNHNKINRSMSHYREGRWWTYNTLSDWADTHFVWLNADQVSYAMKKLVKSGLVIRDALGRNATTYWYTVDQAALDARLAEADKVLAQRGQKRSDVRPKSSDVRPNSSHAAQKSSGTGGKTSDHTTEESQVSKRKTDKAKAKTTPTALLAPALAEADTEGDVDVVVDGAGRSEKEAETGELLLSPEAPVAALHEREGRDEFGLKEMSRPHNPHANDAPIPRSDAPLTPLSHDLSETAAGLVGEMLAVYAPQLTADYAARLIDAYGEDHVRAAHRYVRANGQQFPTPHPSRIFNPPGWITDELAVRRLNLPPVPDDSRIEAERAAQQAADEAEREAQYQIERREAARAELAALHARAHIAPDTPAADETAIQTWRTAHHQLALLFDRVKYDQWLKTARLLCHEDGVWHIAVPSAQAQAMLQTRYYRHVQRVIEGLAGRDKARVVFHADTAAHERPLTNAERQRMAALEGALASDVWDGIDIVVFDEDAPLLRLLAERG